MGEDRLRPALPWHVAHGETRIDAYATFLKRKSQLGGRHGFTPEWLPDWLYPFQRDLVTWACEKGRAAIFADCGLGKTPMQLVWAQNVVEQTNGRVLILTPLAVGPQTVREGEKFGIAVGRSGDGKPTGRITVANYERLHLFSREDYTGVVLDESSILKNFDGTRRAEITEFLRTRPYRLACTATAAPNDYVELGTTSEALGELGHMDMLTRFFRNQNNNATDTKGHWRGFHAPRSFELKQWRFKRHAEQPFWRWVCSWARALRRPSDLGFSDEGFVLPPLIERETMLSVPHRFVGELFPRRAVTLAEQREERRETIEERCDQVAIRFSDADAAVAWCHLNEESDQLERVIPGAVQVTGSDSDDRKEDVFLAFATGKIRVLVTKPRIGAFGLNWQHCAQMSFFPSHSYEQYYQGVRRCWRFGQSRPVTVDIVTTEGEARVLANLQRKAQQADAMFTALVAHMNDALHLQSDREFSTPEEVPLWLS